MSKNQMKFITLAVFTFITLFLFAPIGNVQAGYEPVQYYTGASFLVTGDFSSTVDVNRTITIYYVDDSGQDQAASFTEDLDCSLMGDAFIDGQALKLDGDGDYVSCEIPDYSAKVRTLAEKELGKEWSGFIMPEMNGIWAEATIKIEAQDSWLPILEHSGKDIEFKVIDGNGRGSDHLQINAQEIPVLPSQGFDLNSSSGNTVRGVIANTCGSSTCEAFYFLGSNQIGLGLPFSNIPAYVTDATSTLYIGGEGGGFHGIIEGFSWDPNACPGCY